MAAQQAPDFTRARWRKSSHSYSGNDCVEVAQAGTTYAVRDSKNAGGGHLTFSTADWGTFISGIKNDTRDQ